MVKKCIMLKGVKLRFIAKGLYVVRRVLGWKKKMLKSDAGDNEGDAFLYK